MYPNLLNFRIPFPQILRVEISPFARSETRFFHAFREANVRTKLFKLFLNEVRVL